MTFRPKVPQESARDRFHRQAQAYRDWLQHLTDRTQAARDLIAKEHSQQPQQETT